MTHVDLQPCHTGPAAHTCAFDVALAELANAVTCISCGAPLGSPHLPSCQFRFVGGVA